MLTIILNRDQTTQARQMTLSSVPPKTDAMQAYRLFAQNGILPADYNVQGNGDMQVWLDRYSPRTTACQT